MASHLGDRPVHVGHPDVDVRPVRLHALAGADQMQDHLVAPRVGLAEVGVATREDRGDDRDTGQLGPECLSHGKVINIDHVAAQRADPHQPPALRYVSPLPVESPIYSHCE